MVPGMLSVIIPTFNAEKYLAETLTSVLQQNWTPLELLVVDDGSSDRSIAVAESFGSAVGVIALPHRGLAATRNSGIAASRGEFLLHLDADDLLTHDSIAVRLEYFEASPMLDIVAGRLMCFLSPDMTVQDRGRYKVPLDPQQGHLPGAAIIRATAFERFGAIDGRFDVNADLDWSVRARDAGAQIRLIDDVVVRRRIHGGNMSLARKRDLDISRLKIVGASLLRRRQALAGDPNGNEV